MRTCGWIPPIRRAGTLDRAPEFVSSARYGEFARPALPMGLVRYRCEVRPVSWSYADPVPRGSVSRSGCAASVTTMLTRALRVAADRAPRRAERGRGRCGRHLHARRPGRRGSSVTGSTVHAVRGTDPTYTHKTLADFRNHKRLCGGLWLPTPRRYLVPQGLAVTRQHRVGERLPLPPWLRRAALPAAPHQSRHGTAAGLPRRRSTDGSVSARAPTAGTAAASSSAAATCGSWRRTSSGRSTRRPGAAC